MTPPTPSRRALLRTAGVATAGGLAGCSSLPLVGDGSNNSADRTAYRTWTPDSSGLTEDSDGIRFSFHSPPAVLANRDSLNDESVRRYSNQYRNLPGATVEDVEFDLRADAVRVLGGSFDTEALATELSNTSDSDAAKVETYTGYDIYRRGSKATTVVAALSSDRLLICYARETALSGTAVVKHTIDAGTGNGERYSETSDGFDLLAEELGASTFLFGSTATASETDAENGVFAGEIASGYRGTIDGATTELRFTNVFESESTIDDSAISAWREELETDDGSWRVLKETNRRTDGPAVSITGSVETASIPWPVLSY